MNTKTGVLLVNLGTPDSPHPQDVKRYLHEFLTDSRVIDLPWFWRQILVRGYIVPKRFKLSAASYEKIWTAEGSPLLLYGQKVKHLLQHSLGDSFHVELAMRYGRPTIASSLNSLLQQPLGELVILPLFPHYASATTGSVHQRVMEELKKYTNIPHVTFISHFHEHPALIEAIVAQAKTKDVQSYDHVLFSYHGLPEKQLIKADRSGRCLKESNCCQLSCVDNFSCYAAQCHATTRGVVENLNLSKEQYSLCFQSRLGKDPWLQPYTSDTIQRLAKSGKKRVLVLCPSFVCDCLETLYEIGVEYATEFKHAGGDTLDLVPNLNDHPLWIKTLHQLIVAQS